LAEAPEGKVVHLTPKRIRIKVPAKRYDHSFFDAARERLSARENVRCVEVNPATGSILLHSSDARALLRELERDGAFVLVERAAKEEALSLDGVRRQLADWEQDFRRWTGMGQDARIYIFVVLVLSAVYQLSRGNIFAPAATLLWYASEALRVWGGRSERGVSH
jgi:hypothetical protein